MNHTITDYITIVLCMLLFMCCTFGLFVLYTQGVEGIAFLSQQLESSETPLDNSETELVSAPTETVQESGFEININGDNNIVNIGTSVENVASAEDTAPADSIVTKDAAEVANAPQLAETIRAVLSYPTALIVCVALLFITVTAFIRYNHTGTID